MIKLHCGATPANHVESALFGHEKGAFTGAHDRHAGKFMEANAARYVRMPDLVGAVDLQAQVKKYIKHAGSRGKAGAKLNVDQDYLIKLEAGEKDKVPFHVLKKLGLRADTRFYLAE